MHLIGGKGGRGGVWGLGVQYLNTAAGHHHAFLCALQHPLQQSLKAGKLPCVQNLTVYLVSYTFHSAGSYKRSSSIPTECSGTLAFNLRRVSRCRQCINRGHTPREEYSGCLLLPPSWGGSDRPFPCLQNTPRGPLYPHPVTPTTLKPPAEPNRNAHPSAVRGWSSAGGAPRG